LFLDTTLRIKRFTDRVTELFSITPNDMGRPITDFAHRLAYEGLVKDARAVLADLAPIRREVRSLAGRWYDMRLRPYRTVEDKIDGVVITFVDTSEHHQIEEALRRGEGRQTLLLGELTHRVRNILAVIQAIARQTLQSSTAKEDFVGRFEGRLSALASAHSLLVQSDWRGADLRELAQQQLAAYATDADRLHVEGERISLPADMATPFGLILHELATNAAKHGALSGPRGKVSISWRLEARNNQRQLRFDWTETGGPAGVQPTRHGFGTTLIDSGLPGAQVSREFRPEGFVCSIDLALPETPDHGSVGES
jgi:two-component system CheB/CheR fusion protein